MYIVHADLASCKFYLEPQDLTVKMFLNKIGLRPLRNLQICELSLNPDFDIDISQGLSWEFELMGSKTFSVIKIS